MEEIGASELTAPEPINENHIVDRFDCGRSSLNEWLVRRARRNQASGDSRTYVCSVEKQVAAFYSLAAGQVLRADAPKPIARNAPDPIPIIILGRLAIEQSLQGKGLGTALLHDAAFRAKAGAEIIGARALLVHALDDVAQSFYEAHGFIESPIAPMTLMLAFKHLGNLERQWLQNCDSMQRRKQVIVATGLVHGSVLVTADQKILNWEGGLVTKDARLQG